MIKRNMKKLAPVDFEIVQQSVRDAGGVVTPESNRMENLEANIYEMVESFALRFRMRKPQLIQFTFSEDSIDHEEMDPHFVMVLFLEDGATFDAFETDGVNKICGSQSGAGKFLVFESKTPYEITGNAGSYVIVAFKEAE